MKNNKAKVLMFLTPTTRAAAKTQLYIETKKFLQKKQLKNAPLYFAVRFAV